MGITLEYRGFAPQPDGGRRNYRADGTNDRADGTNDRADDAAIGHHRPHWPPAHLTLT
jgi:hypothetical protein